MAGPLFKDRVKETTTTTGTGTVTLAGAVSGFQSFAAVGNANSCYYCISHQTLDEWEVGIGTYTAVGTSLSRTTVLSSSNSNTAVTFSAGNKDAFVTLPSGVVASASTALTAGRVPYADANGQLADSSGLAWNTGNATLDLGSTSAAGSPVSVLRSTNGSAVFAMQNTSTGAAAYAGITLTNSVDSVTLRKLSTGFTTSGSLIAGMTQLVAATGSMMFTLTDLNEFIWFSVGGTTTGRTAVMIDQFGLRIGGTGSSARAATLYMRTEAANSDATIQFDMDGGSNNCSITCGSSGRSDAGKLKFVGGAGGIIYNVNTGATHIWRINNSMTITHNATGFGVGIAPASRIHGSGSGVTEWIRIQSTAAGVPGTLDMYVSGTGGFQAGTTGFNTSASGASILFNIANTETARFSSTALAMADAKDISVGTTTGTKIGTGTTQKLGFWNAAPVAQKTGYGTPTNAANQASFDATTITLPNLAAHVAQLGLDLKAIGIVGA